MKLPNERAAVVPPDKISGYLLSPTHPDGRHKAAYFVRFGFRLETPDELVAALLNHAWAYDVVKEEPSPFGVRYVIEGAIRCPDGRSPTVRTVWFVENGQTVPRFVTAYPLKEGRS